MTGPVKDDGGQHTQPPLQPGPVRARLEDPPGGPLRTTSSLLASLRDRLAALRAMSGSEAVGSLIAGYAQVGRNAARTARGSRLASALRAGRPGTNGEAVWSALGIDVMAREYPSPVLDHLRNDLALLMADDLATALHEPLGAQREHDTGRHTDTEPVDDIDYLVGMWAFSREVVAAVEALAATAARTPPTIDPAAPRLPPDGPLLR